MVRRKQVRPKKTLGTNGENGTFDDEVPSAAPRCQSKRRKTQNYPRKLTILGLELPCQQHSPDIVCITLPLPKNIIESVVIELSNTSVERVSLVEDINKENLKVWSIGTDCGDNFMQWDAASLGLTQDVLAALSHLASNGCVCVALYGDKLLIHVNFTKKVKREYVCLFMAWLILASKDQWIYPFMDELRSIVYDEGLSTFHRSQILQFISPVTSSVAGDEFVPSPSLLPTLRPYQRAAVAWMLKQESPVDFETQGKLERVSNVHARNRLTGQLYDITNGVLSIPHHGLSYTRGGILADEMGLGKTVQVLACILSHPNYIADTALPFNATITRMSDDNNILSCVCNSCEDHADGWVQCEGCSVWQHQVCTGYTEGAFFCEACLRAKVPQWTSKTTLIISPFSITKQWEQEIIKHTKPGSLAVFNYSGIKAMRDRYSGPSAEWKYCRASELAKFDIVLTTYEALRYDVYHVVSERSGGLRGEKRYRKVLSPLTHVHWWRICMDEAQLVERTQAKAAVMANQLASHYRWWVTGTPFSTSLDDLYGTFVFLQMHPFAERHQWRLLVEKNSLSQRLKESLQVYMWRNCKVDVLDQIGLPPQSTEFEWLDMTDIELHYYQQQLQVCTKTYNDTGDVTPQMLQNLIRLRQACCHPQVGSHDLRIVNGGNILSMDEILDQMQIQAKRECEDAMRALIAAMNGIAGVNMLESNYDTATGVYFDAISLIQHHWNDFQTDLLPRLHIAHNFGRLLEKFVSSSPEKYDNGFEDVHLGRNQHGLPLLETIKSMVGPGFADALESENDVRVTQAIIELHLSAHRIEMYYLTQLNGQHEVCYQKYLTTYKDNQEKHFGSSTNAEKMTNAFLKAWCSPFELIDEENLERLQASWLSRCSTSQRFASRFQSVNGLLFELRRELMRILELRSAVYTELMKMSKRKPSQEDIEVSGNCKKCRQDRQGITCQHCTFKPQLDNFRACIGEKADSFGGVSIGSVLVDVVRDVALLHGSRKEYEAMRNCITDLLHECTLATKLFQAQHARLGGLDELEMAKTTLQIDITPLQSIEHFRLRPEEVPVRRLELEGDHAVASEVLQAKLSQLRYLQHLHAARQPSAKSIEDECVICHEKMPAKRAIWACAHVFCWPCSTAILRRAPGKGARCPTCRRVSSSNSIRLVRDKALKDAPRFGTKIDAILRCIRRLGSEKILLFSQWPEMLLIIATALKESSIPCFLLEHKKNFHSTIAAFKAVDGVCVLALPFRHGANGLNLVEASHVILVEPHLNISVEQQAINRVYRLGQDKPTTVHRFIIQNSIEEGILSLQANKDVSRTKKHDKEEITSNDIKLLLQQDSVALHEAFWSQSVDFQSKMMSRMQCKEALERIRSYDLREAGQRLVDEPTINLCGSDVNIYVASTLLTGCKAAEDNAEDQSLISVLIQRTRIKMAALGLQGS